MNRRWELCWQKKSVYSGVIYLQYPAVLELIITSHALPCHHCPSLPMRVKNVFEWRSISGLIWCPCLASGEKNESEKNTKEKISFFRTTKHCFYVKHVKWHIKWKQLQGTMHFYLKDDRSADLFSLHGFWKNSILYRDRKRKLEIILKWRMPHVHNLISGLDPEEKKN